MPLEFYLGGFFFLLGIIIGSVVSIIIFYKIGYQADQAERELLNENTHPQQEPPQFMEFREVPEGLKQMIFGKINDIQTQAREKIANSEAYKNLITKKKDQAFKSEEFLRFQHLEALLESVDTWFDDRKKWFMDRIGKRIIPDRIICDCEGCKEIEKNGQLLKDENQAMVFFMNECMSKVNENEVRYRDYEA